MDQKETLKPKAIAALKSLREAHIRPSPYMATRVLAHHKSQTRSPQSPFWKWLSIASPQFWLSLFLSLKLRSPSKFIK